MIKQLHTEIARYDSKEHGFVPMPGYTPAYLTESKPTAITFDVGIADIEDFEKCGDGYDVTEDVLETIERLSKLFGLKYDLVGYSLDASKVFEKVSTTSNAWNTQGGYITTKPNAYGFRKLYITKNAKGKQLKTPKLVGFDTTELLGFNVACRSDGTLKIRRYNTSGIFGLVSNEFERMYIEQFGIDGRIVCKLVTDGSVTFSRGQSIL